MGNWRLLHTITNGGFCQPSKPIDYYSPEEIIRIRDACRNVRERAIIEVFRSTGARVGEIAEITMEQVNLETGDIWIQGEKGGKYRTLYLDDDAKHYYRLYLDARTHAHTGA